MQHLRFEGEAVASVGGPILPERAAGSALLLPPSKLISTFTALCRVVHQGSAGAAVPLR